MSDLQNAPETARQTYKVCKGDIGFNVVNPSLCAQFERQVLWLTGYVKELENERPPQWMAKIMRWFR